LLIFQILFRPIVGIEQNATEQNAKRNLDPPLRALQSARASSAAYALSAELRLASHCAACSMRNYKQAVLKETFNYKKEIFL
jgi:hypothetical protein